MLHVKIGCFLYVRDKKKTKQTNNYLAYSNNCKNEEKMIQEIYFQSETKKQ